jgi:hypothetical protein
MKHITCIEDLRQLHKRRVPKAFFDYADRGSPHYLGADLSLWLRRVRPGVSGAARADLHYLELALAGGCA